MEHYTKGIVRDIEDINPYLESYPDAIHMKVQNGSKIKNLMGYAMKKLKEPNVKHITWSGCGNGVVKTVSCAEILKKKMKNLHQATVVRMKRTEEYWEPKLEGLERLKVNRDDPAISIILSKEPLDPTMSGYQPSGVTDAFWQKQSTDDSLGKADPTLKKKANYNKFSGNTDPPGMERKRKRKPPPGKDKKEKDSANKDNKQKEQRQKSKNNEDKNSPSPLSDTQATDKVTDTAAKNS